MGLINDMPARASHERSAFVNRTRPLLHVLKPVLGFFGIYLVSGIVAEIFIVGLFASRGISLSGKLPDNLLTQATPLFGFAFFALGTTLYWRFVEKRPLAEMGLVRKGLVLSYVKGLVLGILLVSLVMAIAVATGAVSYECLGSGMAAVPSLVLLIGYVIQGGAEELMCRGYLMTSLATRTSVFWAIAISSLAFMLPHLMSLFAAGPVFASIGFVNTLLFSVFISLVFLRWRSLWLVAAIHSAWNYVLGVVFGISVSGGTAGGSLLGFAARESAGLINGGVYGLEAGLVTTAVLVISLGALAGMSRGKLGYAASSTRGWATS